MQRKKPLRVRATLENRLWVRLKALEGYHFRRKSPFRTFSLDFVEHDARLVVCLEDREPGKRSTHIVRDRLLNERGYVILQLWRLEACPGLPFSTPCPSPAAHEYPPARTAAATSRGRSCSCDRRRAGRPMAARPPQRVRFRRGRHSLPGRPDFPPGCNRITRRSSTAAIALSAAGPSRSLSRSFTSTGMEER